LNRGISRANGRTGKRIEEEDLKLKGAVQTHGGEDWVAIALLVPGRTKMQCYSRWHIVLDSIDRSAIDQMTGRKGHWTADENKKLRDAVPTHGTKDWVTIAALVPG
jgi:myb proto-oncogene protein